VASAIPLSFNAKQAALDASPRFPGGTFSSAARLEGQGGLWRLKGAVWAAPVVGPEIWFFARICELNRDFNLSPG